MSSINISVVLNVHRESLYLGPTLRSLHACAKQASDASITTELVVVLDDSDARTRAVVDQADLSPFQQVIVCDVAFRSLGPSRREGIRRSSGQFVWIVDGDDLYSSNALVALMGMAAESGDERFAIFPGHVIGFGSRHFIARYFCSDYIVAADFAFQHSYVSNIFVPRSAFEQVDYLDLRLSGQFAYEDWHLNSQLYALGYMFRIAEAVLLFYRQRRDGLCQQADALSCRLIPHSPLFAAGTYLRLRAQERACGKTDGQLQSMREDLNQRQVSEELWSSEVLPGLIQEAAALEYEIDLRALEAAPAFHTIPVSAHHWGFALESILAFLGDGPFGDVVLLPWLHCGGGEKYILQILDALHQQNPESRMLVLTAEPCERHGWVDRLPPTCLFFDVLHAFPGLDEPSIDALVARVLLSMPAQGARLHLKASQFAHRMVDKVGPALATCYQLVYYRFCDDLYCVQNGQYTDPWGIRWLRAHFGILSHVLTDSASIVASDTRLLGLRPDSYHTVYARCTTPQEPLAWPKRPTYRLLWASRLAAQKRPQLLHQIAQQFVREGINCRIDVYGSGDPECLRSIPFDSDNLRYQGPFQEFAEIPVANYDALIYTSSFDGLPNIVLEAMASGLPVIAPLVAGLGECITHNSTGFLVPDLADDTSQVLAYVACVRQFYGQWDSIAEIVARAHCYLAEHHSGPVFAQRVRDVFASPVSLV